MMTTEEWNDKPCGDPRDAEIARLTARAEKAEAALSEIREETIRLNKATDADYAKRLSESQALLAMWPEVAAVWCEKHAVQSVGEMAMPEPVPDEAWASNHQGVKYSQQLRALTPADAQAALDARINAAREEGRVMGLREAADICVVDDTAWDWDECRDAILAKIKEAENG